MSTASSARRLRVGVAIDGARVPGWIRSVLQFLDADPGIDWVVAFSAGESGPTRQPTLLRVYEVLDRWYVSTGSDVLDRHDVGRLIEHRLLVDDAALQETDNGPDAGTIDLLIDLRENPHSPPPLGTACERWWLELTAADGSAIDAGLVSAFATRASTCKVAVVGARGVARSELSSVVALNPASLAVSRDVVYRRARQLFVRRLGATLRGDGPLPDDVPPIDSQVRPIRETLPSKWIVRFAAESGVRAARSRLERVRRTREQWIIGVRRRSHHQSFDDPSGYTPVVTPDDRMYADPFVIEHQDRTFVFFEELRFATGRGVISMAELHPSGELDEPYVVLARPYHLSFPFVIRDGDTWCMIPETASNKTIELYRSVSLPGRWEFDRVLLDGVEARDTTVLRAGDAWWLFTALDEGGTDRHGELHVFRSDDLRGPWFAHPRNPVVSDVRWARSAGAIFRHGAELIRPAQDCSERYGGAIVFRRITELNERQYREETVAGLGPTWAAGLHGAHTYNQSDRFEVVDGARVVRRRLHQRTAHGT